MKLTLKQQNLINRVIRCLEDYMTYAGDDWQEEIECLQQILQESNKR